MKSLISNKNKQTNKEEEEEFCKAPFRIVTLKEKIPITTLSPPPALTTGLCGLIEITIIPRTLKAVEEFVQVSPDTENAAYISSLIGNCEGF